MCGQNLPTISRGRCWGPRARWACVRTGTFARIAPPFLCLRVVEAVIPPLSMSRSMRMHDPNHLRPHHQGRRTLRPIQSPLWKRIERAQVDVTYVMSSSPASQSRKSKKVKKPLLDGVPSSVRYLVWSYLTNGKARCVPGMYAQLCARDGTGIKGC